MNSGMRDKDGNRILTGEERAAAAHQKKREDDPLFAASEDRIRVGQCPPFKYRVERGCMRMNPTDGMCRFLIDPPAWVCMDCWKRALLRTDIKARIGAGEHGEKTKRF
jgi:hypothetical protein